VSFYILESFCKHKKSPRRAIFFFLRCHTIDVSREHGAFFDVGDAEEAGGDALEADGEAAVRGHAVLEGVEVEMERVGVHATTEHLLAVVGDPLRPSASALRSLSRSRSLPPARRMAYPRPIGRIRVSRKAIVGGC